MCVLGLIPALARSGGPPWTPTFAGVVEAALDAAEAGVDAVEPGIEAGKFEPGMSEFLSQGVLDRRQAGALLVLLVADVAEGVADLAQAGQHKIFRVGRG